MLDDDDSSSAVSVSVTVGVVGPLELSEPPVEPVPGLVVTGGAVVENVANVVGPEPVVVLAPVPPGAASPVEQASPKHAQTVAHRKRIIGCQDTSFPGRARWMAGPRVSDPPENDSAGGRA